MGDTNKNWVEDVWYGDSPWYWLLLPLSWFFSILVAARRSFYASGAGRVKTSAKPVIVVGNITVGGTGKTPITVWLARELRNRGLRPGIVSRGYRGNTGPAAVQATVESDPAVVGDEAILLASLCECPVVVHPDRVSAASKVIELGADVVISDDGLQHYRLARDFEIAVVDGDRGFGNGKMLPAGPLREPVSRLHSVDDVLIQSETDEEVDVLRRSTDRRQFRFRLRANRVSRLDASEHWEIEHFGGRTVHAVAGIGHPERFFRMLESHAIIVRRHPLPDHADIEPADIDFGDDLDVLMTEKDAVKCRWLDTSKCWYVPVDVEFDVSDADVLLDHILTAIQKKHNERS